MLTEVTGATLLSSQRDVQTQDHYDDDFECDEDVDDFSAQQLWHLSRLLHDCRSPIIRLVRTSPKWEIMNHGFTDEQGSRPGQVF